MKRIFSYSVVIAFLLMSSLNGSAQNSRDTPEPKAPGGMVTLYALDPLAHTFCFHDGQTGYVFYEHEIRNRCDDLEFNSYNVGSFTVGNEGGRVGNIIDLGAAEELQRRYGYSESILARGEGFASLRVESGKLVILKNERPQTSQELKESDKLFEKGVSLAAAPIKLGHIYLVRLTDAHDKSFQALIKMVVIAYTTNESVTIRWQAL